MNQQGFEAVIPGIHLRALQLQIWKLSENTFSFYKQEDNQGDVYLKM